MSFPDLMVHADPEFPPLLRGVAVSPDEDPAAIAFLRAQSGEMEAGDLVWSKGESSARLAVVLEPEISAENALCMVPLAMVAVADSIGAIGPPNLPITFDWPRTILANGAVVGGVDMRFPQGTLGKDIPAFAILSLELDIRWDDGGRSAIAEPGQNLTRTVLHEEGGGELDRTGIIESWARHFTAWVDTFEQDGFKPVHENWLFRAARRNETVIVKTAAGDETGQLTGMDEKGGLLVKQGNITRLFSLGELWFGPGMTNKRGLQ